MTAHIRKTPGALTGAAGTSINSVQRASNNPLDPIGQALPNRFLNWRMVDGRKVPCRADGTVCDAHDPDNHTDYATAAASPHGVAFDIRAEDGLFFLDLDKCRDAAGVWTPEAVAIFTSFAGAWGEVSQSGTGLHVIGRCNPAVLKDRRNKWGGWLEFYTDKRFVAFGSTGWSPIGGTAQPETDWTDQLLRLVPEREHLGELPDGVDPAYTGAWSDDALIAKLVASTGGAGAAFKMRASAADLWEARADVLAAQYPAFDGKGGYDHSSADAALMSHLAFWTGKDMPRMDRLFRRSGLMREKYGARADYRRDTVQNAARLCGAVYDRPVAPVAIPAAGSGDFDVSEFEGVPVQPRRWLVDDLIPMDLVTILGGDGGTGKSLLALQLAVAVRTGKPWLGRPVTKGNALILSAEDDKAELHRRLNDIVREAGVSFKDLAGMRAQSLVGENALLADPAMQPTALFHEIERRIEAHKPTLVVLDTLANLFSGNENDRAQAQQFVGLLAGLAVRHSCAVLLLNHPSLTGMSSGSGASGSTAWNNSARSRLYLSRVKEDNYESDPDRRVLKTQKNNHGRIGGEIFVHYRSGVFVPEAPGILDNGAKAERLFLKLLGEYNSQGRYLNASSGTNYAPSVFAKRHDSEGCTTRVFREAMDKLLDTGKIIITISRSDGKEKKRLTLNSAN